MLALRDLISTVRESKTAAQERRIIAKECAAIRTAIKEEDESERHSNVAKLLYIHMLGYATHFGQMECLKLISSLSFADKRMGYLGTMLLLDERSEVLMLGTHSIKSDLFNSNPFVAGLAICTLANVCSKQIARDAAPEVQKLLSSHNPFLRKKAALCAARLVRKVPDVGEMFVGHVRDFLTERNHGLLLSGVTLLITLCEEDPAAIPVFRKYLPSIVGVLKTLVGASYTPEYDIHGISDPFLQVKCLHAIRLLCRGHAESSDAVNDILADVATNIDGSRNVGIAVLYECVQTIMAIDSERSLRVLAINILGRFLTNRDNNVRYVALNSLTRVVASDPAAVQRHGKTIVECLHDPDISIRRRALPLIYALINRSNVEALVGELLAFLPNCDFELRPDVTTNVCVAVQLHAPTKQWYLDTVVRVMGMAGEYVQQETVTALCNMIASTPDLQSYAVNKMYAELQADLKQQPIVQVGMWTFGEYGHMVVGQSATELNVLELIYKVMASAATDSNSKQYGLNALVKLMERFKEASSLEKIGRLISKYRCSMDAELQQRSCEFGALVGESSGIRAGIVAPIPAPENDENESKLEPVEQGRSVQVDVSAETNQETLIDLLSDIAPSTATPAGTSGNQYNLLDDILGGGSAAPAPAASSASLLDLLDTPGPSSSGMLSTVGMQAMSQPAVPETVMYEKDGLKVAFQFSRPSTDEMRIRAQYSNLGSQTISGFVFQAAVPKYLTCSLQSPSGNVMEGQGGKIQQEIQLKNSLAGQKPYMMKIKMDFMREGTKVEEMVTLTNFPN